MPLQAMVRHWRPLQSIRSRGWTLPVPEVFRVRKLGGVRTEVFQKIVAGPDGDAGHSRIVKACRTVDHLVQSAVPAAGVEPDLLPGGHQPSGDLLRTAGPLGQQTLAGQAHAAADGPPFHKCGPSGPFFPAWGLMMKICCTGDRSPFNRNRQILIINCHFCPHDCFLYKILRSSSVHEGVALDHVPHKIFDFARGPRILPDRSGKARRSKVLPRQNRLRAVDAASARCAVTA